MRRQFHAKAEPSEYGTEEARALALALAELAEPEFIRSVISAKVAMDQFGGQVFIAADRDKYDASGRKVEPGDPGRFVTLGYIFHYDHLATLLRIKNEREPESDPQAPDAIPWAANGNGPEDHEDAGDLYDQEAVTED